jgi:hypothetical protein
MSFHVIAWKIGRHESFRVLDASRQPLKPGERILRTVNARGTAERIADRMQAQRAKAEEIATGIPAQEDECG